MDIKKMVEMLRVIEAFEQLVPEEKREEFREIAQLKVENYQKLQTAIKTAENESMDIPKKGSDDE